MLGLILLLAATPLADGFDFPVGDVDAKGSYVDRDGRTHEGWYKATSFGDEYSLGLHPGEDWNGRGGGDTDYGQPVHAIGAGVVVEADEFRNPWGKIVIVEHRFKENGKTRTVRSLYAHLSRIDVKKGDVVKRRQEIGAIGKDPGKTYPAHLHLEIRVNGKLEPTFWPSRKGWTMREIEQDYLDPSEFIRGRRKL